MPAPDVPAPDVPAPDVPAQGHRRAALPAPRSRGTDHDDAPAVRGDGLDARAATLARVDKVHRALVQIVLGGGELPDVADELARLLDAVLCVTTPDGRLLAVSGAAEELAAVQASGRFDPSGRLRTEDLRTGVHAREGMPGNEAVVPVLAGGLDHGRLLAVSPTAALTGADLPALERAATVAALVITKQLAVAAVESKYRADFLHDVLTGRTGGPHAVTHAATLGWDLGRPTVVVVAELDPEPPAGHGGCPGAQPRPAQERFAAAWQQVVRARDPRAPVVSFFSAVVAVLAVPPDGDVGRLVRDVVTQVRGDGGGGRRPFSAGVSRVAGTPDLLAAAYEQARTSLAVGRRVHGGGETAHFDALGVFRLLSQVSDEGELRAFVAETLGELGIRADAEAEDLRRTLRALLESNLNVAQTARDLHFHYNTLRYRIGKLERLLGPFCTDPHLRLNVLLALEVLRMRGVMGANR